MTSNIKKYAEVKEYVVTLHNYDDTQKFYSDMEGQESVVDGIPERKVACSLRRPISRNTHYFLSWWEAEDLKKDPRVKSVTLHPKYLGIRAEEFATTTQTSSNWNKSSSTSNAHLNWALLRCTEGSDRLSWGIDGTQNQTATVNLTSTGKNVDVVIIDGDGVVLNHPEYAVNADGTGGSRFVQYNWFQHNLAVKGTSAGTYSYTPVSGHATHVAGTVAGSTQGWARKANIYNIFYAAGNVGFVGGEASFIYAMDYVREFHRTKQVNLETGRKNPTITNNSWGQSIFPNEWALGDITAVTYRGTRYTPSGDTTYTGISGVFTSNTKLADLLGFENFGNRITTSGSYDPPGGDILTYPEVWLLDGDQAYYTTLTAPSSDSYSLTVQGPAVIDLVNDIAGSAFAGTITLSTEIVIKEGDTVLQTFTSGPFTSIEGGDVEASIREVYNYAGTGIITVEYNSLVNVDQATTPLIVTAMSLTVEDDEIGSPSATVSSIPNSILGAASLTASTAPDFGGNDDGFWAVVLPFNISYLGNSYATVYLGTNGYLTFEGGSEAYDSLGPTTPNYPKIMLGAADRSIQRIYYGEEGAEPNRTFRIRAEAHASYSGGVLGSPTVVYEYVFYENTPNQIDLQIGINNGKTSGGGFSTQQLNDWGFIAGQRIPSRMPNVDADIEAAIQDGIIYVGAAGNGRWKHDVPGGLDWDNSFEMAVRYPDSVLNPYYYMRGTTPTANDEDIPNICVGSVDVTSGDYKASYSDCGPGVDIFAPGTSIISSYNSGISDSRNASFLVGKISGTSMASPQVCGVLACALEQNPHWNQVQAKAYITGIAKQGQLTTTSGGPTDGTDLQGAPNKYLYYKKERSLTGLTVPKNSPGARPETGLMYPRPKIYKSS
jgi:hypothetical protein